MQNDPSYADLIILLQQSIFHFMLNKGPLHNKMLLYSKNCNLFGTIQKETASETKKIQLIF